MQRIVRGFLYGELRGRLELRHDRRAEQQRELHGRLDVRDNVHRHLLALLLRRVYVHADVQRRLGQIDPRERVLSLRASAVFAGSGTGPSGPGACARAP